MNKAFLVATILAAQMLLTCQLAFALDEADFNELVGWTVAVVTTVSDEFEGCDFNKPIRFDNCWT